MRCGFWFWRHENCENNDVSAWAGGVRGWRPINLEFGPYMKTYVDFVLEGSLRGTVDGIEVKPHHET